MPTVVTHTESFKALGTTIEGGFRAEREIAEKLWSDVHMSIAIFEARFSRFQEDSELSQLNRSAGRTFTASQPMMKILQAAQDAFRKTDGLVDPTVGNALITAGYDSSFEQIKDKIDQRPISEVPHSSLNDVRIDFENSTIVIPTGVTLDFGGIGKGYLLDYLVPMIEAETTDYWLSLGGDLVVSGNDESGHTWTVGVQNPLAHDQDLAKLQPPSGRWGIATSGTTKRRGRNWHHLIYPRTGRPVITDTLAGVVLAPTALEADTYAKTVLILGSTEGINWATNKKGIEALAVTDKLQLVSTTGMRQLLKIL